MNEYHRHYWAHSRGLVLITCSLILVLFLAAPPQRREQAGDRPPIATLDDVDLSPYPWVYLRHGRPLTADEQVAEIIVVGDILLGREVSAQPTPLRRVTPWLTAADLTVGNLESTITTTGLPRTAPPGEPQPIILNAPVTAINHLAAAGFDLLSLANNHSLDYGEEGLQETVRRLQTAGLTPFGLAAGSTTGCPALISEVNGVKLAFWAVTAVPDPGWTELPSLLCTPEKVLIALAETREWSAAAIIFIHWGFEYQFRPDPGQRILAQQLLAAGADIIIGHGPHVVQPVEVNPLEGTVIAYSLGNFVFDQSTEGTQEGLALRLFVDQEGMRALQGLPVWSGPQPELLPLSAAESIWVRIQPAPLRQTYFCDDSGCQPVDSAPERGDTGWFWSGGIDLTGDGRPELVRRAGETAMIYADGALVWQSPATWQVLDLALGDPNDDGRYEMLLAIRQPDAEGIARSQPVIVGYREGAYRLLWGGRPVRSPILAVELGDVDGDGAEELVVLEEAEDGRRIAVWRWQGWNFSLFWRSSPGDIHQVSLEPDSRGRLLISTSQ